eukprot:7635175-Alexandrium_andersonii.AAC.1
MSVHPAGGLGGCLGDASARTASAVRLALWAGRVFPCALHAFGALQQVRFSTHGTLPQGRGGVGQVSGQ